jgi:2'-5' RNA ligase
MYFVALVAPDEINQPILKWKLWMKEKYQCEVALRSPAHITLIAPFWMKPELETELIRAIAEFSDTETGFFIHLKNFSCFKPTVIFVDVAANEQLISVKNKLTACLLANGKFPLEKNDLPFHPHVTIATRDLHKKAFHESWEYFKDRKYAADWKAEGISLLRHNKKNWDVIVTSRFK